MVFLLTVVHRDIDRRVVARVISELLLCKLLSKSLRSKICRERSKGLLACSHWSLLKAISRVILLFTIHVFWRCKHCSVARGYSPNLHEPVELLDLIQIFHESLCLGLCLRGALGALATSLATSSLQELLHYLALSEYIFDRSGLNFCGRWVARLSPSLFTFLLLLLVSQHIELL